MNKVILRPCLLALGAKCGLCKGRGVGLAVHVSALELTRGSVTYGGRINGQHPCVCAESKSRVFEVEAGTAVVVVVIAVAIAVVVSLAISVRARVVVLVTEPKVGTNATTSKDNEGYWNTKFDPF